MSFITDTGWPDGLITIFNSSRTKLDSFERRYYGPFDKLLNHCFRGDPFKFYVGPQSQFIDRVGDDVDHTVFFVVFDQQSKPVLFVDVKDDGWNCAGLRSEVDGRMRKRYWDWLNKCPLPRLYGLSFLGTSLRVYYGDGASGVIGPKYQARPADPKYIVPQDFLREEWSVDLLSQQGFDKMKEIVTYIMEAVASDRSATTPEPILDRSSGMSFLTDKTWPDGLRTIFDTNCQTAGQFDSRYYGPYDKLLNHCFRDGHFKYYISPGSEYNKWTKNSYESIIFIVVFNQQNKPVLMVDVPVKECMNSPSGRLDADASIRKRYNAWIDACPLPRLYGLSFLGTSLRVYCCDRTTRVLEPGYQGRQGPHHILPRDFLDGEWSIDILSQQGFDKMKEVVTYIIQAEETRT